VQALQEFAEDVALNKFNKRFGRNVLVVVNALAGLRLEDFPLLVNLLLQHKCALQILLLVTRVILLFITCQRSHRATYAHGLLLLL
jgi:hypothetical protein